MIRALLRRLRSRGRRNDIDTAIEHLRRAREALFRAFAEDDRLQEELGIEFWYALDHRVIYTLERIAMTAGLKGARAAHEPTQGDGGPSA